MSFSGRAGVVVKEEETPAGWCPQRDWVADGKRRYRCSVCRRRLFPRLAVQPDGELAGWRLPPHKPKGFRIRKKLRRR